MSKQRYRCESSGAARMKPRPWPARNILAKIFTGALYQFSTLRKTSVTDDIIDWPLPNKIIGCATVRKCAEKRDKQSGMILINRVLESYQNLPCPLISLLLNNYVFLITSILAIFKKLHTKRF